MSSGFGGRPKRSRSKGIWPKIVDAESAWVCAQFGYRAALIVAAIIAALSFLALLGYPAWGFKAADLITAATFGVVGYGIHRLSRAAAVISLILFPLWAIKTYAVLIEEGHDIGFLGVLAAIFFLLYFIHGLRGTFASYKFLEDRQPPPPA